MDLLAVCAAHLLSSMLSTPTCKREPAWNQQQQGKSSPGGESKHFPMQVGRKKDPEKYCGYEGGFLE